MSASAGFAVSLAVLVMVAALSGSRGGARLGLLVAAVALPLPAFVNGNPVARVLLAFSLVVPFVRGIDFAGGRAAQGFAGRLVFLLATFACADTSLATRTPRTFHTGAALNVALAAAAAVLAAALWQVSADAPAAARYAVRCACAAVVMLALAEGSSSAVRLIGAAFGYEVPATFRQPYLSRSVSEFWNRRWNPAMGAWLRRNCFAPLAVRGTLLAVVVTFGVSAALHAYLVVAVDLWAALLWASFFLAQPALIFAERALNVRRWPSAAAHAWTAGTLTLLVPLLVTPVLSF